MPATLIGRPHIFERGDRVFLTTPLTLTNPTDKDVEEYAFASVVKGSAPNDNIGWLSGRYVEAGRANLNGAMWLSEELAVKSLTPMLMPVTVMHDPRTAVGTIADCKFQKPEGGSPRIDDILAIWKHRFPDVWEEAVANIENGTMMQSMECFSPWYTCADCDMLFQKLPKGAEQASWCDHLRGNGSSTGRRILGDVCFTGTGLIFGTRGGVGAYTEAHLDHFHDEIAEYHERAHVESYTSSQPRSTRHMSLVQIEESELATLRTERDQARSKVEELQTSTRDLTTKVEQAEAAKLAAETKVTDLTEAAQAVTLRDTRIGALGTGFMAKLGPTSKAALTELAGTTSDADWDKALTEREELAGVKRDDATSAAGDKPKEKAPPETAGKTFEDEEVARFVGATRASGDGSTSNDVNGAQTARSLAKSLARKPAKTAA